MTSRKQMDKKFEENMLDAYCSFEKKSSLSAIVSGMLVIEQCSLINSQKLEGFLLINDLIWSICLRKHFLYLYLYCAQNSKNNCNHLY